MSGTEDNGSKHSYSVGSYFVYACPNCGTLVSKTYCICGYRQVQTFISLEQYFGGLAPSPELEVTAKELLLKVNSLLTELGVVSVVMTSGYRSPEHNAAIGGAKSSKHCLGAAIDLADNDRAIGNRIMTNLRLLTSRGLYMESLPYCETAHNTKWVHWQSIAPLSGNTVFRPYAGDPVRK